MDKNKFEELLLRNPERKFCLYNGFAGFAYGMVSNPKWISNEKALSILTHYEKITGLDPIDELNHSMPLYSLLFDKKAFILRIFTFRKVLGFNLEKECCYGKHGLG